MYHRCVVMGEESEPGVMEGGSAIPQASAEGSGQIPITREIAGMVKGVVFLDPGNEKTQNIVKAISHQCAGDMVRILSAEGPLRLSVIADRMDISLNAAKYHIRNLMDAGILEITDTRYSVKGKKVKIYGLKDLVFIVAPNVPSADQIKKAVSKCSTAPGESVRIILKWDKTGKITFFNDFGQQFFGFHPEEIIGKPVIGTIVPDRESCSERNLHLMINEILIHPENHTSNENENVTKDGRRVWIRWNNKPIYDDEGEFMGIFSIGTDMTENKAVEESIFLADGKPGRNSKIHTPVKN